MTLPAFAPLEELDARIKGGIPSGEEARAQAALDDASSLIRVEAGLAGAAWIVDDELADDIPEIVATVCLRAAQRVFVNPDETTQETAGPFSVSRNANVYLTTAEKAMISRAAGKVSGIGVISTTRGCIETPLVAACGDVADEYVDVYPAGEPLPFL